MPACFFVSDLHGRVARYDALWQLASEELPAAIFMGGDLLPNPWHDPDFLNDYLFPRISELKRKLGERFPEIYLIPGNDDGNGAYVHLQEGEKHGLWHVAHFRQLPFASFDVFGYAFVPPTPYLCKDWEKYDVSQYVDLGSLSPQEGIHSQPVSPAELQFGTIQEDLEILTRGKELAKAIFLFHAPPWNTDLDHADLEGKLVDGVPLDVHIGSIAIRRFLDEHQPLLSLHGHIHESPRITGNWRVKIGSTWAFSAAHDGGELSLVRFDPDRLEAASRELVPVQ